MSDDQQWYYCLQHKIAEQGMACANSERMGPYASRQEADNAIATASARTEAWDNDPRWKDD